MSTSTEVNVLFEILIFSNPFYVLLLKLFAIRGLFFGSFLSSNSLSPAPITSPQFLLQLIENFPDQLENCRRTTQPIIYRTFSKFAKIRHDWSSCSALGNDAGFHRKRCDNRIFWISLRSNQTDFVDHPTWRRKYDPCPNLTGWPTTILRTPFLHISYAYNYSVISPVFQHYLSTPILALLNTKRLIDSGAHALKCVKGK
jgi:hypothetical protein